MIRPYSNNAVWIISQEMMARLLFCAFALLAASHAVVTAHSIAPSLYTLDLYIDTAKNTFSGSLVIDAQVQSGGATFFTLNNKGLDIATVSVVQGGANIFSSLFTNQTEQTTKISTSSGLTTGSQVKVTIAYQGNVSTEPTGLYSFVDKGQTIYMTNLYPIYARKLFPCFDEPGIATPVALRVTIPSNTDGQLIASSDVSSSSSKNGVTIYQLKTTIPIAPYSLFFTIGNWDSGTFSVSLQNSKVYVPPSLSGKSNLIDVNIMYASSNPNISQLMPYFIDSVNIFITPVLASNSYSGLKTVVLKKDISITDMYETTTEIEKNNYLQITYAFYRLFYGTVNRPSTWGNNWLARSIPLYLSYESLDYVNSMEKNGIYGTSDQSLVTGLYEQVFKASWSADSPVPYTASPLTEPEDILAFISSSGVEKGVYALKSLETFIDPGQLRSSCIAYLIQTNGTTMETEDFIKFLSQSLTYNIIGGSLSDVFKPMISEAGYPLIELTRSQQTLTMLKSSFADVSIPKGQSFAQTTQLKDVSNWLLPITAATWTSPSTQNSSVYFVPQGSPNTQLVLTGTYPVNGWALLNLDGKGMMRVSYDATSWLLFKGLTGLTPAMRAKLIADAFATAEASTDGSNWLATLAYLQYLDNETELAPWKAAVAGFRRMWSWVYETNNNNLTGPFVTYWQNRLTNIYNRLGNVGSNGNQTDPLRREVVSAMCEVGGSNCTADLAAQYQKLVNNVAVPSTDMYSVVVCNGVKGFTTVDQWNTVFQNYVKSGNWYSQAIMDSHYGFLACPASSTLINAYLTNVLLKTQAMMFAVDQVVPAVKAILDRPEHVDTVLAFVVQNQASLNVTDDIQAEIISELGQRMSTNAQVTQLQTLNNATKVLSPVLVAAIQKAATAGAQKAIWVSKVQDYVQQALNGVNPTPPPTTGPTVTTTEPTGPTSQPPTGSPGPTTVAPPTTPKGGGASTITVSIFALLASFTLLKVAQ